MPAPPATLTALWDFNGSWATTNNNHAYDLTPGGGVTFVSSPLGQAAEFHGGTYNVNNISAMDRADTGIQPTNASLNSPFSIMGWVKTGYDPANLNSSTNVLGHDRSSSLIGSPYNSLGLGFYVYDGLQVMLRDNQDHRLIATTQSGSIQPQQWFHVAATWDGSFSGGIALYINGQLATTTVNDYGFQGLNGTTPLPFRIGSSLGASNQLATSFNGSIDQLSLWQGVLTPDQIRSDFNITATTTAVIANANPSTYGQTVTFTASVSGSGATPTGTIAFKADGSVLAGCGTGGVVSLSGGSALCATPALTVAGSPHAITADYSGDATYVGSSGSLANGQTVNKASANVTTWPAASAITYGQTLASSALSGGAATPAGSFAFTSPATAPSVGTAAQGVTYTPTDTANYNAATNTVSVTVNKANPSVTTWPAASAITYGQTLASSTLSGGVATPAGSFAFALPSIAPNAGTAAQSVTYTPTNTANYNTASGTVNVTVNKAGQTISFGAAPTVIVGGTGTVSATSTSGLTVTFGSTTPAVCTTSGINGSTVTGVVAGSCTIAANQAGNANYNDAPQVTQSFNVTAGFGLTVINLNPAGGTITSDTGGIVCGATCNANFATGTSVTLTAIPVTGYQFSGWGGACFGYGNSCTLTMDAAKSVSAKFEVFKKKRRPSWKRGLLSQ